MFDRAITSTCLALPVGFRQTKNPAYPQLALSLTGNKITYLNDLHPLITIENIKSIAPQFEDYATALVTESDLISNYLTEIINASALEVPQKVFQHKKLLGYGKTIMENVKLFDGAGSIQDKIIKSGRFVGLALRVKPYSALKNIITKIGLQADTLQNNFNFYIYHSSQYEPIAIIPVTLSKAGSFQWFDTETVLEPEAGSYINEGMYYVGYYESNLVGQAIQKQRNLSVKPCSCTPADYRYYEAWSQFYNVHPFTVDAEDLNGTNLWDITRNQYTYTTNFGLNLELMAQCDLSPIVCRYAEQFSYAVGLQATEKLINAIAYNTRNNAISRETRTYAMHELNENKTGIPVKLQKAIEEIEIDLSDLESPCLPERNKSVVSYTGV